MLDGAGLSGTPSRCSHGVAWYTRQLGGALLAGLAPNNRQMLTTVLADAINQTASLHAGTCQLDDPGTPSATVIVLRRNRDQLEYLVLADSVLLLDQADHAPLVVSDDREADVGRLYRATMDGLTNGTPEHDQARRDYVQALRAHRNKPGGFWVAAADPSAADEAIVGSRPVKDVTAAALLSDGASRLTDIFGLTDWAGLLAILRDRGPAELIRQVRAAEDSDLDGGRWPRGKTHDDATATYCTHIS
ncbi:hypothetical protein [Micromonospora endophytica]|uniref:hypothetical protein n=1 Tax=Micromonospora endophytica TaxID=515350 RepID=UPI001BB35BCE|nr:hypothetical protein [Micromonospora endophytica]